MNKSSGNVLFLILIAVALFAALAYAVTQSSRSGGGDISKEKMQLAFDEMQNVIVSHRTALQRMIMGGVDINQIETYVPNIWQATNGNCNSDACRLYNPKGGGLSFYNLYKTHPELTDATTDFNQATNGLVVGQYSYAGTELADFLYTFRVTEAFCNFINTKLGITTPTSAMTPATIAFYTIHGGHTPAAIGSGGHMWTLTSSGQAGHLEGRKEGCFSKAGPEYWYVALIYAN